MTRSSSTSRWAWCNIPVVLFLTDKHYIQTQRFHISKGSGTTASKHPRLKDLTLNNVFRTIVSCFFLGVDLITTSTFKFLIGNTIRIISHECNNAFQVLFSQRLSLVFPSCLSPHCSGPNRGHYITIVKSHGFWLLFDDDIVEVEVLSFFILRFLFLFNNHSSLRFFSICWKIGIRFILLLSPHCTSCHANIKSLELSF